jgi:segregation and condensation protein B
MAKRETTRRAGRGKAEAEPSPDVTAMLPQEPEPPNEASTAVKKTESIRLSDMPGFAMRLADEPTAEDPSAEPPVSIELKAIIESLIFASPEPLTPKALFKLLDSEPREDVERALASLKADYQLARGLQLVEIAGGLQIVTRTDLHEWVRRLFHERKSSKLSVQALETLAVIAYRQPVTSIEIAEIRGVNTSGVLATLMERKLVKIAGRKPVVGRPFLYATTREFLMRFGLNDLTDLPKVEDMADVLGFDLPGMLGEPVPSDQFLPLGDPDEPGAGPPDSTGADPASALAVQDAEPWGAQPWGAEPEGAEPEDAEPGDAEPEDGEPSD